MENNKPKGKESVDAFKARLRRTALGIPQSVILKGVASMKERAKQIYDAEGATIQHVIDVFQILVVHMSSPS